MPVELLHLVLEESVLEAALVLLSDVAALVVELDQLAMKLWAAELPLFSVRLLVAALLLVVMMLLWWALSVVILELWLSILLLAWLPVVMPSLVCLLLPDPIVAA